jgi:hemerythrin-like domain-containing protein
MQINPVRDQTGSLKSPATGEKNIMSEAIGFWRAEHANFASLLRLLEKRLYAFHTGGRPDYELMLDIVQYLRHFPDRYHHPREDVAFACLARHDPSLGPLVTRLHDEHRRIAEAGDVLYALLTAPLEGSMVGRNEIEAAAQAYLMLYRQHIASEEISVMPRAMSLLTDADWAEVARAHPQGIDPLFGADADASYKELRRQISLEAG